MSIYEKLIESIPATKLEAELHVKKEMALGRQEDVDDIIKAAMKDYPVRFDMFETFPGENHIKEMCMSCFYEGLYLAFYSVQDTLEINRIKYLKPRRTNT